MRRSLCYDVTSLVTRMSARSHSGTFRVDLAYGRYLANSDRPIEAGVHYGLRGPHLWKPERVSALVRQIEELWREDRSLSSDPVYARVRSWILGGQSSAAHMRAIARERRVPPSVWARQAKSRALHDRAVRIPPDSIYLNIAQHAFEHSFFFDWLRKRPDVRPVFMVHDLLPLFYPEYFWAGCQKRFNRRVATMTQAAALIATTETVREKLEQEMDRRGRSGMPIFVEPLPSPIEDAELVDDLELAAAPYFVMIGTFEPRKNHLLMLNLWRDFASLGGPVPKLVLIGARGWDNEQIVDMLERCRAIQPHVIEATALSPAGLNNLLRNARALLMPSFDEGYGLPVVEALSLGTPVLASDAPVFREVGQGRVRLEDPIDGLGWRRTILALADKTSPTWLEARDAARQFKPPSWSRYFERIEARLAEL